MSETHDERRRPHHGSDVVEHDAFALKAKKGGSRYRSWAELLRTLGIDGLACPKCQGALRLRSLGGRIKTFPGLQAPICTSCELHAISPRFETTTPRLRRHHALPSLRHPPMPLRLPPKKAVVSLTLFRHVCSIHVSLRLHRSAQPRFSRLKGRGRGFRCREVASPTRSARPPLFGVSSHPRTLRDHREGSRYRKDALTPESTPYFQGVTAVRFASAFLGTSPTLAFSAKMTFRLLA